MDNRAVSSVVEKTITIGLVALLAGTLTASLVGGAVPDYQRSVGSEVGDRVLAAAASGIERALPASRGNVTVQREVALPETIERRGYTFAMENRTLSLRHPDPSIGGSTGLAVPPSVTVRNGTWDGGSFAVRVGGTAGNRTLFVDSVDP